MLDAVGCNIRVDSRGSEVMRVLPRLNEDVNEEWISDKTRFSYDGLRGAGSTCRWSSRAAGWSTRWKDAFAAIRQRLEGVDGRKVGFIVGDLVDGETMVLVRELAERLGCPNVDCRQDGAPLDASNRAGYLFNSTIAGIEQADACLWSGRTRAGRPPSSTPVCASAGVRAGSRSPGSARRTRSPTPWRSWVRGPTRWRHWRAASWASPIPCAKPRSRC